MYYIIIEISYYFVPKNILVVDVETIIFYFRNNILKVLMLHWSLKQINDSNHSGLMNEIKFNFPLTSILQVQPNAIVK